VVATIPEQARRLLIGKSSSPLLCSRVRWRSASRLRLTMASASTSSTPTITVARLLLGIRAALPTARISTVEFSLWYYGPWFQMLTAFVQSFDLADPFVVRHAMTFLVGLAGLAALLPIGWRAGGPWTSAIA
jgi:hypothetical protein